MIVLEDAFDCERATGDTRSRYRDFGLQQ